MANFIQKRNIRGFWAWALCAGLFAAPAAAAAGGGPADTAFVGVGLLAVRPQSGALRDRSGPGLGASLSLELALSKKHALRAAVEYAKFGDGTYYERGSYPGAQTREHEGSADVASVALDYIYRFISHGRGPYVAVGAGFGDVSVRPDNMVYGETISGSGFRCSAGVGFNLFKNLGLEASAVAVSTHDSSRQVGTELFGWYQAALRCRLPMPGSR
jgi:hypothetical protein